MAVNDVESEDILCGMPPDEIMALNGDPDDKDKKPIDAYAAEAYYSSSRLWEDETTLKVFFMHSPVDPSIWTVTTDKIIDWANLWTEGTNAPKFEKSTEKDAPIRVKFSNTGACWCKTGTRALKVKEACPTMVLNLGPAEGVEERQKSLVLHEFGHVLGFEHEHQRMDLWEAIYDYIDTDEIRRDEKRMGAVCVLGKGKYKSDWLEKKNFLAIFKSLLPKPARCAYDGESIMHFEFKKTWLKREYRNLDIDALDNVKYKKQKKFLHGIFMRIENPFPNKLSSGDKEAVLAAYP